MLPSVSIGDLTSAASLGMPRVPSLEFLKQLSHMQQMAGTNHHALNSVKLEVGANTGSLPFSVADLANLNANVAFHSLGSDPSLSTLHPVAAQAARAAAHAAAIQLNQLSQLGALPPQQHQPAPRGRGRNGHVVPAPSAGRGNSGPSTDPDTEDNENENEETEMDPKKAKSRANRMLSNRESARRSRRRKQEHLGKLEFEISILTQEKHLWEDKMAEIEERCFVAEDECRRLREENARLREGQRSEGDEQPEKRIKTSS